MADSPRRRYSRSPSPYSRGHPKARSRSRSPAQSQSRSPVPDPRSQARSRSRSHEREEDAVNRGNTLYVTGLSSRVTEKEVKDYFSKDGRVVGCHVVLEPHTRVSRGFAFVTMDTVEEAERCIKYLNNSVMEGRNITVEKGMYPLISRRGRPMTPTPGSYLGSSDDELLDFLGAIEPLNGRNYFVWRERIDLALALNDLDYAITHENPTPPIEGKAQYEQLQKQFRINKDKWDKSNIRCLMVITSLIGNPIGGPIYDCGNAKEYLSILHSRVVACWYCRRRGQCKGNCPYFSRHFF